MVKTAAPAAARVYTPAQQRLARVFPGKVLLAALDMRHLHTREAVGAGHRK
jgi:hypothetical protein